MRVLVACEFSGIVRDAFSARGHWAVSCDLIRTEKRGKHIVGDVIDYINKDWDLMLAFPPCTYLAASGSRWFKERREEQSKAIDFVVKLFVDSNIPRICLENPVGVLSSQFGKPDQIIHPWQFGCGETKATCLWLKGLPKLKPTNIVEGRVPRIHHMSWSRTRGRDRSRTYVGIAEAMATQWDNL